MSTQRSDKKKITRSIVPKRQCKERWNSDLIQTLRHWWLSRDHSILIDEVVKPN